MNKLTLLMSTALLSLGAAAAQAAVQDATTGGDYCREYQQTLTIAGKTQRGFGTACLQPDGSWELQNGDPTPAPNLAEDDAPPPPNIHYYVEEEHVFVAPPEPYVVGTVFIDGERHHFDRGFRPYHHWR